MLKLLTICLLVSISLAHVTQYDQGEHRCNHDDQLFDFDFLDIDEENFDPVERRVLAVTSSSTNSTNATNSTNTTNTTTTYPNIRMVADFSYLNNVSSDYKSYFQNDVVPAVLDYLQATLTIKYPVSGPLKLKTSTLCGYPAPSNITTGVNTDFYIIYDAYDDIDGSWVASSTACFLASGTNRPLFAKTTLNMEMIGPAYGDLLINEKNIYLIMHEVIHTLGFSNSLFPLFLDANGVKRVNHIKYGLVNGENRTFIDVEPLTTRLRQFYGCSSVPGAMLENYGSDATAGSHFERKNFVYEVLTSGVIHGRRISQFTLGMLEGSGWYVPDYTFAEPFFFGQGQGCDFLYGTCPTTNPLYDEFCTGSSRDCTAVGRGGGYCSSDPKADGCKYVMPNKDYDCMNDNATLNTRLPNVQTFGRTAGSQCFSGNLSTKTGDSQNSFCFKYTCQGTGLSTTLLVQVGSVNVTCTTESTKTVSGYAGIINCPDPLTFCNTAGKKFCPRNCMGRGTCVNNVCVCKPGFSDIDCSVRSS